LAADALAISYCKVEDGRTVLLRTEVPQELSGEGYASKLAHGVIEGLRRDGRHFAAKCHLMSSYTVCRPKLAAMLGRFNGHGRPTGPVRMVSGRVRIQGRFAAGRFQGSMTDPKPGCDYRMDMARIG
jgi:uncharacterized protein